jgi:hypothetical protein
MRVATVVTEATYVDSDDSDGDGDGDGHGDGDGDNDDDDGDDDGDLFCDAFITLQSLGGPD